MTVAHVTDPIYGARIVIVHATSVEVKKARRKHVTLDALADSFDEDGDSLGRFTSIDAERERCRFYIIYINAAVKTGLTTTVYHEALHGTISILNDVGMALSRESEEAYTYHQGWLAKEILKVVKR